MDMQNIYKKLLAVAEQAMLDERFTDGIFVYNLIYRKFPALNYCESVYSAMEANDHDLAAALADEAINKFPGRLEAWLAWGQVAMFNGDWQLAADRWEEICKRFPNSATCLAGQALAWLKIGELGKAQTAAILCLGIEPDHPRALAVLANASLLEQKAKSSLKLAQRGIAKWDMISEFYDIAIKAYLAMEDYAAAESLCLEARAKFENAPDFHVQYAKIALARKDYAEAASRAADLRSRFPHCQEGYTVGADAAALAGNFAAFGEICMAALKFLPGCISEITVQDSIYDKLLEWCREPLAIHHDMQALRRFESLQAIFPHKLSSYTGAINILLAQRRGRKAEELCLLAISRAPLDVEAFYLFIESLWMQKKLAAARNYCILLSDLFPGNRWIVQAAISKLLRQGDASEARSLYTAFKQCFSSTDYHALQLIFALDLISNPENVDEHLHQFTKNCVNVVKIEHPLSPQARLGLNLAAILAKNNNGWKQWHIKAIEQLTTPNSTGYVKSSRHKKLCFYGSSGALSYLSAVLKHIPACEIDIISRGAPLDAVAMARIGLDGYNYADLSSLDDYQYVITDIDASHEPKAGQTIIRFFHGSDVVGVTPRPGVGAFIFPFETAGMYNAVRLVGDEYKLLENMDNSHKIEIAITGPFHISPPEITDKNALRKQIESIYGIKIPADRPLVFILEGETCSVNQLILAINRMVSYATVILKPAYITHEQERKINKNVHVIRESLLANNLVRYASDFILAELWSGTLISSLMLNIPVIPYYSRTYKLKWGQFRQRYPRVYKTLMNESDKMPQNKYLGRDPKGYLMNYLDDHNLLFDILDSERLKDTILNNKLADIFSPHLPTIQKEVFGWYMKDGAPQKTAELVLDFCNNGTFGKNCHGVIFH